MKITLLASFGEKKKKKLWFNFSQTRILEDPILEGLRGARAGLDLHAAQTTLTRYGMWSYTTMPSYNDLGAMDC